MLSRCGMSRPEHYGDTGICLRVVKVWEESGLSQEMFANMLGRRRKWFIGLRTGQAEVQAWQVKEIARMFHVSAMWLLYGEE